MFQLRSVLPRPLRRLLRRWQFRYRQLVDAVYLLASGKRHLPPYSLRMRAGGVQNFEQIGAYFLAEFRKFGLIRPGQKVLEVGCGCGRNTLALAADAELKNSIRLTGMDVDAEMIRWCQDHITWKNPNFTFYHVDLSNTIYNPEGGARSADFVFPHPDGEFDFIFVAGVFSNFAPDGMENYLRELRRVLKPDGLLYTNIMTYESEAEAVGGVARRPYKFPHFRGHYAVLDADRPEGAIAYRRDYYSGLAERAGLRLREPVQEGLLDTFIFSKQ